MDRGFEQLIFAALILLAGLADWIIRALRRRAGGDDRPRADEERAPLEEPSPWEAEFEEEPVLTTPIRVVQAVSRPAPETAARAAPPRMDAPVRRRSRLIGDAADLRRAILLKEILGPCRGLEEPRSAW